MTFFFLLDYMHDLWRWRQVYTTTKPPDKQPPWHTLVHWNSSNSSRGSRQICVLSSVAEVWFWTKVQTWTSWTELKVQFKVQNFCWTEPKVQFKVQPVIKRFEPEPNLSRLPLNFCDVLWTGPEGQVWGQKKSPRPGLDRTADSLVLGSQKSSKNRTKPDFGNTN